MIFKLKVISNSKTTLIEELEPGYFKIKLPVIPQSRKANRFLIKLLAGKFGGCQKDIMIIKGKNNKNKVIDVNLL